jgi:hypothetical protein
MQRLSRRVLARASSCALGQDDDDVESIPACRRLRFASFNRNCCQSSARVAYVLHLLARTTHVPSRFECRAMRWLSCNSCERCHKRCTFVRTLCHRKRCRQIRLSELYSCMSCFARYTCRCQKSTPIMYIYNLSRQFNSALTSPRTT